MKSVICIVFLILLVVMAVGCTESTSQTVQSVTKEQISSKEVTNITPETTSLPETPIPSVEPDKESDSNLIVISDYIYEKMSELQPIYKSINDGYLTENYDQMSADALKITHLTEDIIDEISTDAGLPKSELLGSLSSKEQIVFNKFIKYVNMLNDYSYYLHIPLGYVKEDPSKISEAEEYLAFQTALEQRKGMQFQAKALFASCEDYGLDCIQNDFDRKDFEKA